MAEQDPIEQPVPRGGCSKVFAFSLANGTAGVLNRLAERARRTGTQIAGRCAEANRVRCRPSCYWNRTPEAGAAGTR